MNNLPSDRPPLRAVHRAIAALRRGELVVLAGAQPLVLLAAETASAAALAELAKLGSPVLLLAAPRAASVLPDRPVSEPAQAVAMTPALLTPASLRSLADPTAEQVFPEPPIAADAPAEAATALALVKLASLLPAVLAVPPPADAVAGTLLAVPSVDVLGYPLSLSAGLQRVAEARVPLADAPDTRIVAFRPGDGGVEHLAILVGRPEDVETPLVRVHSACFTGDLLGSLRCDCGAQLQTAIARMAQEGAGALIYLAQEGRGIGLVNKLRAYTLQDRGLDTLDANRALGWAVDERNFLAAAIMLEALGIRRLRLLTNNPGKVAALTACGVEVVKRVSHIVAPNGVNDRYLAAKAERLGHLLK